MKKKKQKVIEVQNLTKKYRLRHEKPTLVNSFFSKSNEEIHTAVNNISFDVFMGDSIGIIGDNGSGKTTLLKLISGITKQNSGKIIVKGKVVSLIDLTAGFHPELTGEENIYLNGLIIGMTITEIEKKKQKIINFADIGKFMDSPLYTYSSGMKLRLGFSIAIHSNPDILLVDEGFAVGDENFRNKIAKKLETLKKNKVTLIMVSHWMGELKKNCSKFLHLRKGKIVAYGGKEVISNYTK